ncbi:MAG: M20/M25/M40 family metallo-hydrolase [Candidatus Heimdallarchaeota archaeon]|nr:MAG: M20/M25/M40 family metallo-hydrolase [Candidatus Heimdallarchaeota archaeon]
MVLLKDLEKFAEKNLDNALEDLFKLTRIPTVTAKGGEYSSEAITELNRIFRDLDFETLTTETKGEPVFTSTSKTDKPKTLLFYDHYDVQPAEPFDQWTSPPFEPEIREGMIYGRGVADNKGNIIARVYAIKMIQELHGELPVNVKFIIEGEEEVSSPNLKEYVDSHHDFLFSDQTSCIWEFGGTNTLGMQEIWGGVKGICYVQLKTTGPNRDLHSAYGSIVENPANHLVAALASLRNDQTDKIQIENFYNPIITPSKEVLEAILKIKDTMDEEKQKEQLGIKKFIGDLHGEELLKKYYLNPTCTICGIWSGWQGEGGKTVLPAEAHAKLDFRLVPNQTPEDVIQMLRDHFKKNNFNVEIEWFDGYRPAFTPLSVPFVGLLKETMLEVYGHTPIIHPWSPASGPLYLFADHIPVLSIGVAHVGSRGHAPNENIKVEDFKQGQVCLARLMEKMAET